MHQWCERVIDQLPPIYPHHDSSLQPRHVPRSKIKPWHSTTESYQSGQFHLSIDACDIVPGTRLLKRWINLDLYLSYKECIRCRENYLAAEIKFSVSLYWAYTTCRVFYNCCNLQVRVLECKIKIFSVCSLFIKPYNLPDFQLIANGFL